MANRGIAVHHLTLLQGTTFNTNLFLLPSKTLLAPFHSNSCSNNAEKVTNLDEALYSFDEMLQTRPLPSSYNFTRLLNFVTEIKQFSCSIDCFKQMCAVGVPVNKHIASIVVKCYSRLYQTKHGLTVLGCCFKQGILPDTGTYNTLLKGFIVEEETHEAERLFKKLIRNQLCEPNLVTYNTMITGLCKIGNNFAAIGLVRLMDGRGCKPNLDTYNMIIESLCKDLMVDDAFKLFKGMFFQRSPVPPDVVTYNSLISALCKLGRWDEVSTMMKQMEAVGISPDMKTFNVIFDALCKQGKMKEAAVVMDLMIDSFHMPPDIETVNSLMNGYCLQGDMMQARATFDKLGYYTGIYPNVDTYNIVLDGYCKDLNIREAYLFHSDLLATGATPKPNMVAHNILSVGKMLSNIHAMRATNQQQESEVEFSMDHPYAFFLTPNSKLGNTYEDSLAFFRFMEGNGSKLNLHTGVYNILIDGAIKCGRFDTARRLFHDLLIVKGLRPDANTYKLMISGFARRGLLKDATKLLFEMEETTICPQNINEAIRGYLNNNGSFDFDDVLTVLEETSMTTTLRVDPDNIMQNLLWVCLKHVKVFPKRDEY